MNNEDRKPWVAVILTLLTKGLGHLYTGEIRRGLALYFLEYLLLLLAVVAFLYFTPSGTFYVLVVLLGFAYTVYCVVDAILIARRKRLTYTLKKYNKWYVYLSCFLASVLVVQPLVSKTIKSNLVEAFKIPSGAMIPTLLIGDRLLANKLIYKTSDPKRGDIIIFPFPKDPSKNYVKRLIGIEGDIIEIKDKQLYVNGQAQSEPYIRHIDDKIVNDQTRDNYGPVKVPPGSLFFMGDNRDNSYDSRFFGFVPKDTIKGKAFSFYWSWDSDVHRVRWDRIGKPIQ
ncbi:MAG TPA: signal peptidase I [Nitrospirota bacterium]|nr:signal peptidase I [Nitrospirota bacterium]